MQQIEYDVKDFNYFMYNDKLYIRRVEGTSNFEPFNYLRKMNDGIIIRWIKAITLPNVLM